MKSLPERIMEHAEATPEATPICPTALLHLGKQGAVFKGGTSLSKVWRAIRRFSEDINITYDIRDFAPDLVAGAGDEALPPTRSQEKRWTKTIRSRLAEWVRERVGPLVEEQLGRAGFTARIRTEAERLHVGYEPLFESFGTIRPEVQVDFGARSTGEPAIRQCFSEKTTPAASGSTTKRRSRAASGSFHPAPRRRCSPTTTPACLAAGCCWKRMSRLARSWSDARWLRREPIGEDYILGRVVDELGVESIQVWRLERVEA